jgi:hypothetical protein
LVARGQADLWDGALDHAIDLDEFGNPRSVDVWTGTRENGAWIGTPSCNYDYGNEWGLGDNRSSGRVGGSAESTGGWITQGVLYCSAVAALYCVGL